MGNCCLGPHYFGGLSAMPVTYDLCVDTPKRSENIPLRLTHAERKLMRLVRAVISASNYTDLVDDASLSPAKRLSLQLKGIFSVCVGLIAGTDRERGLALLSDPDLSSHQPYLQRVLECTRRYKILNPDLMRTDYAKILYMLEDSVQAQVTSLLGVSLISEVRTVKQYCTELGIEGLLEDEALPLCTTPVPAMQDRKLLNRALRHKNTAVSTLARKYVNSAARVEDVEIAIYSLADHNQYAADSAAGVCKLMHLIRSLFKESTPESPDLDLGIVEGHVGSRLTHSHSEQYLFVLQTMTFWKNILMEMYSLWTIAERDMLDASMPYVFEATGQGYHRVQRGATNTLFALQKILQRTKAELGGVWVGSDRIHLGDHQVPSGLYFLDKYTQVPRIVNPILRVISFIDEAATIKGLSDYIKRTWKNPRYLKKIILADFLRHGFDGSGGDTLDDAGSCVDGRLTSTWQWCNAIQMKPFYPFFLLAGVSSFEGDLQT